MSTGGTAEKKEDGDMEAALKFWRYIIEEAEQSYSGLLHRTKVQSVVS